MERYDIAIIGTGPAGLSAAVTATVRNKKVLLLGNKNLSDKVGKAHDIQNYLGLPDVSGENLAKAFQSHLDNLGIQITQDKVNAIYPMGEYYSIQSANGSYESKTVILATGVNFGRPLPGEEKLLGKGVSYCATCDAFAVRGRKAIVIGYDKEAESEADFLSQMAQSVTYIPMYKDEPSVSENVTVLREVPVEILGADMDGMAMVSALKTRTAEHQADMVFVLRDTISPTHLIPGLQMDGNHVEVNLQMETNLPGCFACGDLAGKPYQYIKSAGQGNVAALAAVGYLSSLKEK